ncbi:MAG: hypothetical protein ACM31D_14775 [Bacteroidota bacterium]
MSVNILMAVWSISLVLAMLAVAVLARPLRVLLVDICGTDQRARFWTLYACALVVLAPLLMVSLPGLLDAAANAGLGAVLQRAVFYSLVGIIGALLVMGYAVWRPVAVMAARGLETAP